MIFLSDCEMVQEIDYITAIELFIRDFCDKKRINYIRIDHLLLLIKGPGPVDPDMLLTKESVTMMNIVIEQDKIKIGSENDHIILDICDPQSLDELGSIIVDNVPN